MPKRIVLMTMGTRGDVQPVSVLAGALSLEGYDVRLAVPDNFLRPPDRDALHLGNADIELVRCGPDMRALLEDPQIKDILSGGIFTKIRQSRSVIDKWVQETMRDAIAAGQDADAILFHPKVSFAIDVAEANGALPILFAFQPMTATSEFPLFLFPWSDLGGWLNRLTYKTLDLSRLVMGGHYNRMRKEKLGLEPVTRFRGSYDFRGTRVDTLYSISPSIIPTPSDWPENAHCTGYWSPPPNDDMLDEDLVRFIVTGTKPIYIGFGSMPIDDADMASRILLDAIDRAGVRAVIGRGWGRLAPDTSRPLPKHIHIVDSAPHELLFPRMAGVVHHGGAGTTTAGLRAGRPTLICPFLVDQPFWARRVHALGAGPPPQPPKTWRADHLAAAFRALVENTVYQEKAEAIGKQMQGEDGVAEAVRLVGEIISA